MTHRFRGSRHLLVVALTFLIVPNTGCRQIMSILGSLIGGGGGGGFNPAALGGLGGGSGLGSLPGLLGGSGAGAGGNTTLAPNSMLPAPPQSAAAVNEIAQMYGVRVYGQGAVSPYIDTVKEGLLHYPVEKIRGLGSINMPVTGGAGGVLGDWSTSGGPAHVNFYIKSGARNPLWNNTVVHEFGHHATLYYDDFGNALQQSLGSGQFIYPSDYSMTSRADLLAEVMAFALLSERAYEKPLQSWRLSQPAKDLLEREIVGKRPKV